jgi:hypothetical protein
MKAEVKITKDGLDLGREHDLKRYIDLAYETAENGTSDAEMKKENTYRHMDSQATRRGAMTELMRYYLEDNPAVENGKELCSALQENIDEWEEDIESEGGQFLGNAGRNSAISDEYDSFVLELLILGRDVTEKAILHDLNINIRNTAFNILQDSKENITFALDLIESRNKETEDETLKNQEDDFKEILPIIKISIEKSIELAADKLNKSKKSKVKGVYDLQQEAVDHLTTALSDNQFWAIKKFYDVIRSTNYAITETASEWQKKYADSDMDQ